MYLDNDEVLPGDRLYDLRYGNVSVKQVYADSILIKFRTPAGREQLSTANPRGVMQNATKRTLYWQDPIIVIPRKDVRIWEMQKNMLLNVTSQIGNLLARPDILPQQDMSHLTLAEAQERGLVSEEDAPQLSALRRPSRVLP